jgi:hypothetical protein
VPRFTLRSLGRLALGTLVAALGLAQPVEADARPSYLVTPDPAVAELSPAYRYANMSDAEAMAELDQRKILYLKVPVVPGVRAPIRLTGRLHGVYIHSSLPPDVRVDSPFEILDARLALALDDFAAVLEQHDIDELIHYTMYRPNVAPPSEQGRAGAGHDHDVSDEIDARRNLGRAAKGQAQPTAGKSKTRAAPPAPASKVGPGTQGSKGRPAASPAGAAPATAPAKGRAIAATAVTPPAAKKTGVSKGNAAQPAGKLEREPKARPKDAAPGAKQKGKTPQSKPMTSDSPASAAPPSSGVAAPSAEEVAGPAGRTAAPPPAPRPSKRHAAQRARRTPSHSVKGNPSEAPRGTPKPAPPRSGWAPPGTRHPAGLAIDVGALRKRDGTWLSVARHFQGKIGDPTCGVGVRAGDTPESREIRSIVCECADLGIFTYVLTPNYNAAHADHYHMEIKPGVRWFLYH